MPVRGVKNVIRDDFVIEAIDRRRRSIDNHSDRFPARPGE